MTDGWEASDAIALGSLMVSALLAALAILVTIYHEQQRRRDASRDRREEIALEAEVRARAHVLQLLIEGEAGFRSVIALRDKSNAEIQDKGSLVFLERTADQLEVVGEIRLANALKALCAGYLDSSAPEQEVLRKTFVGLVRERFAATDDETETGEAGSLSRS
ncbi:MAG: hypothetical protein WBM50_13410 [Acidimicrobiales bacterium]